MRFIVLATQRHKHSGHLCPAAAIKLGGYDLCTVRSSSDDGWRQYAQAFCMVRCVAVRIMVVLTSERQNARRCELNVRTYLNSSLWACRLFVYRPWTPSIFFSHSLAVRLLFVRAQTYDKRYITILWHYPYHRVHASVLRMYVVFVQCVSVSSYRLTCLDAIWTI